MNVSQRMSFIPSCRPKTQKNGDTQSFLKLLTPYK
jgi:hypothetical protein